MGRVNENKEEDERKIAIRGSLGCLTILVIMFFVLIAGLIFAYVYSVFNLRPSG